MNGGRTANAWDAVAAPRAGAGRRTTRRRPERLPATDPLTTAPDPVLAAAGIEMMAYRRGIWPLRRTVPVLRGADLVLGPGRSLAVLAALVWRRPAGAHGGSVRLIGG